MTRAGDLSMLPAHVGDTVITVGTFDGVHRGHLDVLSRLAERARDTGRSSVLVTFDPHPLALLRPDVAPLLLTSREEKLAAIAATGIDYVAVVPFTRELSNHSAEQFVDLVLRDRIHCRELLIGYDHGFGKGRAGDVETLRLLGASRGFRVEVIAPVETSSGTPISSSKIRSAIVEGNLAYAEEALGRRYAVSGRVVPGDARGRSLGFRTINLQLDSARKQLPPDGVYAIQAETPRGAFGGMMNLGGRPTFGDERRSLEAHLFDAEGDFYGDVVSLGFVAWLRATRKFDGPQALIAQLGQDEADARNALTLIHDTANLKGSMHFPPSTT